MTPPLVLVNTWHPAAGQLTRRGRSPLGSRGSLVAGTYKPELDTVGIPAGVTLADLTPPSTAGDGYDLIIDEAYITANGGRDSGGMFSLFRRDVHGWVTVRAADVLIDQCRIRGGTPKPWGSSGRGLVQATHGAVDNLVVQDSTLIPDTPDHKTDGVFGHHYTTRRCLIEDATDGLGATNLDPAGDAHVRDEGSYIRNLHYMEWPDGVGQPPEVPHSDHKTHNDCVQAQGGRFIHLLGTRFEPGAQNLSSVMITGNISAVHDITIERGWFDHVREFHINISQKSWGPVQNLRVLDNKFGRDHGYQWVMIQEATTAEISQVSGNVYEDDGSPVLIHNNG